MTITTRSKRVSSFAVPPHTPSAVGPGAYAPEKTFSSFKVEEKKPLFSGFAASEKRELNVNKTTSAITPGPGAYAPPADQRGSSPALSNVFATKISRFAPSAPGSSVYMPSTVQDNPGPGAYLPLNLKSTSKPQRASTSPEYSSSSNNQVEDRKQSHLQLLKPSVPTIPRKDQSYGYIQVGTELKRQAQPTTIYSGIGHDTVGPAAYSHHQEIWDPKKNAAASLKSSVKRDVWEQLSPRAAIPGPGAYEPPITTTTSNPPQATKPVMGIKSSANKSVRQSAVFASKVPILPDPKRIEVDKEKEQELLAKEERLRRQKEKQVQNQLRAKVEAFGSTTNRTDVYSHPSVPYSDPTYVLTPGPGRYRDPNVAPARRHDNKHRKKRFAHATDEGLGFSSATERHCLSKTKVSSAPGPGSYYAETPRTMEKSVKSKLHIGRHGIFGTTSDRVVWDQLDQDHTTPGPGAYGAPTIESAFSVHSVGGSAAFKSSTSRFTKRMNPHASPHVHCIGDDPTPAVGQYDLTKLSIASPTTSKPETSTAPAPFWSTAERGVFQSRDHQEMPGPGAYDVVTVVDPLAPTAPVSPTAMTRTMDVRATIGNEARFRVKPTVPPNVGPGAYSIPGTVGTKSFNVTMKAQPTQPAKPRLYH